MSVQALAYVVAALLSAIALLLLLVRPRSRPPVVLPPPYYQGIALLCACVVTLAITGASLPTEFAIGVAVLFLLLALPAFVHFRSVRVFGATVDGVREFLARTPELSGYRVRARGAAVAEVVPGSGERGWILSLLRANAKDLPRVEERALAKPRRIAGALSLVCAVIMGGLGVYVSMLGVFNVAEGDELPELTLVRLDGSRVATSSLRGKVAIINFFATWCGPCVAELGTFEKDVWPVVREDPDLELVTIDVGEEKNKVEEFLKIDPHPWPFWLDTRGDAFAEIANGGIPKTLIVDRSGRIRYLHAGWGPDVGAWIVGEAQSVADE